MKDILCKLLKEKGLTVYKLAKEVGIPQNTIRAWLYKGTKASGDKLAKVADYLGVSVEYLMGMEKPALETEDELIKRTIAKIRKLNPDQAAKAFEYIELLEMQLKNQGKR